jgi:hypothetical protein
MQIRKKGILKGTHPGTIPATLGLIWFSGFRGEDLNVIFYQNMPNLHNRYISAERKISQKNPENMLFRPGELLSSLFVRRLSSVRQHFTF